MKESRILFISGLVVFNTLIDQISKFWIRANVDPAETPSAIFGNYFTLHNVENFGAFLGMGSDFSPVLKIILLNILPLVVLVLVLVHLFKDKSLDLLSLIGFSSIVGGGISNVFDRIVYRSVTDFLFIDLGGVFKTGIFNLADVSVMVGMGCLILSHFKRNKTTTASTVE